DVISTLKKMGHEVHAVGLYNQLNVIGNALMEHKPHVAFNLLEEFHGYPLYDQHVVSYLELMKQTYTGCNPRGLTLAHDKALTKMLLAYHRLQVPSFAVFPMNRKVRRPKRLKFPLLVKSISEEGSVGISQASVVHDDEKLTQRVEFIHRQNKTAAIAEQYNTLERLSKRIYRYLFLSGYARLDYRLTDDSQFYLLEANPNPQIAAGEDFADSAAHSGLPYDQLLQKIITVGLNYHAATQGA